MAFEPSSKKVYSRTATTLFPHLQPEHGFCCQNGPEIEQIQPWYVNQNYKLTNLQTSLTYILRQFRSIFRLPVKYPRWDFLRKWLTAFNFELLLQKAPPYMLGKNLNSAL